MRAKSRYDNCQSRQWRLLFGDPRTQSTPSRYRQAIDLIKPRFVFAQRVLITLLNTACKLTDSFSPWSSFYHSLCLLWSQSNTERRCNGQFKYFCSVFAVMGSFIFCRRLWRWNPERAEPFENEEQRPCSCWSPEVTPSTKMALIEQGDTAAPENCQRLVILGSSKVGKTSLVSRFLNNKFDDGYTPTIEDFHRKIYRIKGEAYRLDILDTSGNHPFPAMRRLSIITGRVFQYFFLISNVYRQPVVTRTFHQIMTTILNATKKFLKRSWTADCQIIWYLFERYNLNYTLVLASRFLYLVEALNIAIMLMKQILRFDLRNLYV